MQSFAVRGLRILKPCAPCALVTFEIPHAPKHEAPHMAAILPWCYGSGIPGAESRGPFKHGPPTMRNSWRLLKLLLQGETKPGNHILTARSRVVSGVGRFIESCAFAASA